MKVRLSCPFAEYSDGMKINCKKTQGRCAHVYFKSCKGFWVLSPQAALCPVRKGIMNG